MSLTRNEIVGLLKAATAYDGRERGQADVLAWLDSAERAGWTYNEALDAVKDHFAFNGGFLTPATITQRITTNRQNAEQARLRDIGQARRAAIETTGTSGPADPARIRSLVEALAGTLGWQRYPQKPAAFHLTCPHCQAAPGRPCARKIRRGPHSGAYQPLKNVHNSRTTDSQNTGHP